ncbi:hypothetical protein OG777_27410 [Micromonospora peucetia]|uniref:Uncharacterized protein n=1 Tax=Micromonospora peucetia TaxID=47871 RepID=A0A1C6VY88_9ACTN|nr:hypothetical protein [Micromonospora peucetia]MCX4390628.1 hypothetical protein [Micromonospora peucetia]SCL71299.1 hypothetical protein GA0070608_4603 [Micromonospora peucetia]
MPTPKLPADVLAQLRQLHADYESEFADGGYTDRVQKARSDHAIDFILFLEGRFSPATEKGKQRRS